MRVLWVDGSAGAAGDMLLGALVDLGVPLARMRRALERLGVRGWTLRSRRVVRCGLAGRRIVVRVAEDRPGRGWRELGRVVRGAELDRRVEHRALGIFRRLVEAEAEAHGSTPEAIHLHEAGSVDAIVDVVGCCVGLEELDVERIVVSPLTTGWGDVSCAHGTYPVPGPATTLLVRGCPVRGGEIEAERLTPTGAAILTTLADAWGPLPPMRPLRVGYGAGSRDLSPHPNMLRLVLGTAEAGRAGEPARAAIAVLECTVDDVTPQVLAHAAGRLLEAGALEVFTAAVTLKKARSGHHVTVLARPESRDELSRLLVAETGSLGVRYRIEERLEVERTLEPVRTRWGTVRVKRARLGDREVHLQPEYEDCAALARRHGLPLRDVQREALDRAAARKPAGGPAGTTTGTGRRAREKRRSRNRG